MSFDNLITNITTDFFKGNEKFLYLSLPRKLMERVPNLSESKDIKVVDLSVDYSPLKPFLRILKENNPVEKDVVSNTYQIQRDAFLSYFKTGTVEDRKDFVVLEELFFEKKMIRETVVNLYSKFVKDKWIVLNAQELSRESIDILKNLVEKEFSGKIIFCFDISKIENSSQHLIEFVESISRNENFFEITNYEGMLFADSVTKVEWPEYDTIIDSLRSCRSFLALEQASELSKWIVNNFDALNYPSVKKRYIYLEMAIVSFYLGNTDEASFYLTNVIEGQSFDEEELCILGMLYMSQVLYVKNACVSALKYANLVMQHLENKKDSPYYAIAYMLDYRITERSEGETSFRKYQKAQDYLHKCGLVNCGINTSLIMPWALVDKDEGRRLLKPIVEKSIEQAKAIGNLFALSTAYHWSGILISFMQGSNESLQWYYKCNEIRTEIGELSAMVKIRNGLSFEYLIRAEYSQSYDLINMFLNRLVELNDYPEIIITLSNVAKALFFGRKFDEAYVFFQKILYLQHLFGLEEVTYNSFVPEYNDIMIFKSMIDFYRGESIHTKITLHNIENNGRGIAASIQPFIDFMWAMIEAKDGNLENALNNFDRALTKLTLLGASVDHCIAFIYYEFAALLKKVGLNEESDQYYKDGFEFAKARNLIFYTHKKDSITLEEYLESFGEYAPVSINFDVLIEKAEKERLMVQLHKRLRDSQFLNRIMTFASNKLSEVNYISNVAQATFDYTMAEAVYVAAKEVDGWNLLASVARSEMEVPTDVEWTILMEQSVMREDTNFFYDEDKKIIFANISKFEFTGAVIIVPAQNVSFTLEELGVINVALSNLQAHIVMLKQNEHLLFISSTDQLSMLKNRRALQEQLSIQSEMIRRYNNKRDMYFQIAVEFIDLDNFKYYNDNFGHEAGDLLISKFGELLRHVFRKVDFISRFGGDEFVVLLPNTNCAEARRAAERVHEALEKEKYFIPALTELLERPISVPENRRIGFSTGICSNFDVDDITDMETVMACADHALYHVKETEKGAIAIWTDIKDQLPAEEMNKIIGPTSEKKEKPVE